jgi:hypothetical protein
MSNEMLGITLAEMGVGSEGRIKREVLEGKGGGKVASAATPLLAGNPKGSVRVRRGSVSTYACKTGWLLWLPLVVLD